MILRRDTIRRLYREAIFAIFGIDDPDPIFDEDNDRLKRAIKKDVHYGKDAPGGWCTDSILEIYCESGIPNASDINDFSAEMREFGLEGNAVSYNSDKWTLVDDYVNLFLEATGSPRRFYHEPFNNAVINIHEEPPF